MRKLLRCNISSVISYINIIICKAAYIHELCVHKSELQSLHDFFASFFNFYLFNLFEYLYLSFVSFHIFLRFNFHLATLVSFVFTICPNAIYSVQHSRAVCWIWNKYLFDKQSKLHPHFICRFVNKQTNKQKICKIFR